MGPGASLSCAFFTDEVRPVVQHVLGHVGFLAGRLGSGSDVIGRDDDTSRDHDFGCRLTLLVDDDAAHRVGDLDEQLEAELPDFFSGHPVRFQTTWDGRTRHKIDVHTVHEFAHSRLGFDLRRSLTPTEWLCLTGQSVLEVVGGPVFHDSTASYRTIIDMLSWYPDDLWYFVLASAWQRLSQELPFVGRTGQRGDEAGSRIVAGRLSRDLMHLAFVLNKTWPPYPKWMGTALLDLPDGPALGHTLEKVTSAGGWQERQSAIGQAVEQLAGRQRDVGLPTPSAAIVPFFDRPYVTTHEGLVTALTDKIEDDQIRELPRIGSIEQWCDNVDLLCRPARRAAATRLYEATP